MVKRGARPANGPAQKGTRGIGGARLGDSCRGVIIREIKARAADFELCEFVFEGRAMNGDAHNLAKFSSSLDQGRHLLLGAPHEPFIISVNLPVE
jgi:hypothetical protein